LGERPFSMAHMKKAESRGPRSTTKPNALPTTIDEYLASIPEPARSTLGKIRAAIRSAAPPEATETISYGIPTFRYKGALVAFASFSKHCSFFPMGASVLDAFESELKGFRTSKGTLQFPLDKPLSMALVKKLVKARVAQNERKNQR
jgi:uncharacterized protein YdhG (YjbR/CyaY superfamily)